MAHAISWFEIPATDFERATTFYNTIFDMELVPYPDMEHYAMFPAEEGEIGGAVGVMDNITPRQNTGTVVYLNAGDDLSVVLDRVEDAGGTVTVPKMAIPGGFIAVFTDSEGNSVGLHSPN